MSNGKVLRSDGFVHVNFHLVDTRFKGIYSRVYFNFCLLIVISGGR